jgi:hypothetical protein
MSFATGNGEGKMVRDNAPWGLFKTMGLQDVQRLKDLNQWEVKWWKVKKEVLCMGGASKEVWMSLHKTSF